MNKKIKEKDVLRKGMVPLLFILLFFFPTSVSSQGEKGIEELIKDLQGENALVRWTAAGELGRARDVRAVEPLIEALQDTDKGVRREVVKALGTIGDPRAVEPLGRMLEDDDEVVRMNALRALQMIGDERVVDLIISALKNDNPMVRMNASVSLGKRGDEKALVPLEELAATDRVSYVRYAAQEALLQIRRAVMEQAAESARMKMEETPPRERRVVADEKTAALIAAMKEVAERVNKEYGLILDYMNYDIMDLLDIEARMKVKHSEDTMQSLFGRLLTKKDKERNKQLFPQK
ncbi:MAG: HEAT repeat domain-containing protein [Deltaproteobacteria bacterium]|nr:MAG: HEAT repeat domain-containing protein [Deltaproteobacteria bacterium]